MTAQDAIAAFLAAGGKVTKVEAGATIGITGRDWKRLVRGEDEPVEVEPLIAARGPVRIHAGHGAR